MELGEKLLQARTEAGLSQRQLCGDMITRNMLSQIEHGTAKPSMGTLQYLASRLGKPVSFFLEDALDTSVLEAWNRLQKAEDALDQGKHRFAGELLDAVDAGTLELKRKKLLLLARIPGADLEGLCRELPSLDEELLLRAKCAFQQGKIDQCLHLLESMEDHGTQPWNMLRGRVYLEQGRPGPAAECFLKLEETQQVCALLERCYRELEDYKQAYYYAVKQKK